MSSAQTTAPTRFQYLNNIAWQWGYVLTTTAFAVVVPRYMIRSLGEESYGIWVLAFSLIEYTWIFDMGLSPAVQNFTSRFHAEKNREAIFRVVNTVFFLFLRVAIVLLVGFVWIAPRTPGWFNVSARNADEFSTLVLMTGFSFASAQSLRCFASSLEGIQRFDITNRIRVIITVARSFIVLALLFAGAGLKVLGLVTVTMQTLSYLLYYREFRRVWPDFRLTPRMSSWSTLRELAGYGAHAFAAGISGIVLNFSAPVIIGRYRPVAEVGHYNVVQRLISQFVLFVDRAALVSAPKAASLASSGNAGAVSTLSLYANRYALALFVPVVVVVILYGFELVSLWIDPDVARRAAPLFPILAFSAAIAQAGQAASGAILFGIAKIKHYSRAMMAEAALSVALSIMAVKAFGTPGVAAVYGMLMVLNRGLITPLILCRQLGIGYSSYMAGIYVRPGLCGAALFALGHAVKSNLFPGRTWTELILGAGTIGLFGLLLAFVVCLQHEHRAAFVAAARARIGRGDVVSSVEVKK